MFLWGDELGIRNGSTIIWYPGKKFAAVNAGIDTSSLKNYTDGGIQQAQGAGVLNFTTATDTSIFSAPQQTTAGTSYTQTLNPENPQGAVVRSSTGRTVFDSGSTAENLAAAGGTPEQIGSLSASASGAAYTPEQLAAAGVQAPAPRTIGPSEQPLASQTFGGGTLQPWPGLNIVTLPSGMQVYQDNEGSLFDAQGNPFTGGGTSTGNAGTASSVGDPFNDLFTELETYLKKLEARGMVLNPNIEITPEKIAEFTAQAEREINPYFSSQLKLARESLLRSAGYATDEILRNEAQLERQYGNSVRKLGETAADQGFAQSGLRQRDERQLAQETQDTIGANRRQLGYNLGSNVRSFAQQYGVEGLPSLGGFGTEPTVGAGESRFGNSGRTLPYYQLSPEVYDGLVGEQEFARRGAVKSRSSELEGAFRTDQALAQQRQLIL